MKIDFDPETGHVLAKVSPNSTLTRDVTDEGVIYAVARWLHAHFDGDPDGYQITGPQGTFRLRVDQIEPEGVPYA